MRGHFPDHIDLALSNASARVAAFLEESKRHFVEVRGEYW